MLVKCINNDIRTVEAASELGREIGRRYGPGTDLLDLTVGRLYVVYGLVIENRWLRYIIADDFYSWPEDYPLTYLSTFFEVVDRRISSCWTIGYANMGTRPADVVLSFEEWTTERAFYERLVDGEKREKRIFQNRKEFMDFEFPNPSVDRAELIDSNWVLCPKCSDAWQPRRTEGMTRCPGCETLLSNPLFEERR